MPLSFDSRTISFLIVILFGLTTCSVRLHGQESAFDYGGLSASIDPVNVDAVKERPSDSFTQQDDTIDATEATIFNTPATAEAIEFPNTETYLTPTTSAEIDRLSEFGVPYTESRPRSDGLFGGIGNYFREASLNAPDEGITISILGGGAFVDRYVDGFGRSVGETFHVGDALGFSIGKRFNRRVRSDFEFSWRKSESAGYQGSNYELGYARTIEYYETELKHFSGMLNVYYDFERPRGSFLTPYIGMGVGVSQQDFFYDIEGQPRYEQSETGIALQAMIGVSAQVTAHSALFMEQRAFSISENNQTKTTNEWLYGLRYTF